MGSLERSISTKTEPLIMFFKISNATVFFSPRPEWWKIVSFFKMSFWQKKKNSNICVFSILCPFLTRKWQKLWTVSLANNFILNFVAMAHINPSSNYRNKLDKLSILTAFLVKKRFSFVLCFYKNAVLYHVCKIL